MKMSSYVVKENNLDSWLLFRHLYINNTDTAGILIVFPN